MNGDTTYKTDWTIHCARCGCVSSTVRRDHDNIPRCAVCYREEFERTHHQVTRIGAWGETFEDWEPNR